MSSTCGHAKYACTFCGELLTRPIRPSWRKAEDGSGTLNDISLSQEEACKATTFYFVTLHKGNYYEYRIEVPAIAYRQEQVSSKGER